MGAWKDWEVGMQESGVPGSTITATAERITGTMADPSRRRRLHLVDVDKLVAGTIIRHLGEWETVTKVERSTDGYHWRVWLDGSAEYHVFPPTARFTYQPQEV